MSSNMSEYSSIILKPCLNQTQLENNLSILVILRAYLLIFLITLSPNSIVINYFVRANNYLITFRCKTV